jgi:hypothetical protein
VADSLILVPRGRRLEARLPMFGSHREIPGGLGGSRPRILKS